MMKNKIIICIAIIALVSVHVTLPMFTRSRLGPLCHQRMKQCAMRCMSYFNHSDNNDNNNNDDSHSGKKAMFAVMSVGLAKYAYDKYSDQQLEVQERQVQLVLKKDNPCQRLDVVELFKQCKQDLGITNHIQLLEGKVDAHAAYAMAYYFDSIKSIWLSADFFTLSKNRQRMLLLHELRHWQQANTLTSLEKEQVIAEYVQKVPWYYRSNDLAYAADEYDADKCAVSHTKCFYCLLEFMLYRDLIDRRQGYMGLSDIVPYLEKSHGNCTYHTELGDYLALQTMLQQDPNLQEKWHKHVQEQKLDICKSLKDGNVQQARQDIVEICKNWSHRTVIELDDISKI